jgi:uncharacterized membrane protein (DUF106 family)
VLTIHPFLLHGLWCVVLAAVLSNFVRRLIANWVAQGRPPLTKFSGPQWAMLILSLIVGGMFLAYLTSLANRML